MGITFDESKSKAVIGLEGAVDISSAAELKTLLLRALHSGKKVRVSLDKATDLDVTAVELLWAAEREASKAGVKFSYSGPAPAGVSAALSEAGLQQFLVPQSKVSVDAK
ncbi:MAG: STAS domain-containing protein [Terracidiphilus sp.]